MNNTLPTYQNLFGTDNYYTAPNSRSVLSPAAYLVELLKLVDNNITVDTNSGGIPLQTRRPDIYQIILDKINTENELPKLDIVNGILKGQVNTDPSAATFPFALPYNKHLEEVRHYLAQNNFSLEKIWKKFNKGYHGDQTISKSIFLETLGISQEQWQQYSTDPAPGKLYLYYGYSSVPSAPSDDQVIANLGDIQTFLAQTGLTQTQLHELVYEDLSEEEINNTQANYQGKFYINSGSNQPISISGANIQNLNPTNVTRIMRFVRMAQVIGWSFTDLDWALQAIRPLVNSRDEALPYLAWIQEQIKQNGLTVNQCCGFLGQIKDFGEKNGPYFFDKIFSNPQNPQLPTLPATWNVPQPGSTSQQASNDKQIESALSAALQLSQGDLLKAVAPIVQYVNNNSYELALNPTTLALLYRMSLLPRILNKSLSDIFVASKILSQEIGLVYCLLRDDYPVGNILNIINPAGGGAMLTGQITGISPQTTGNTITYTISITGNQTVQLVLDLPGQVFSSLSIDSSHVSGLTAENINQFVYTGLLINNLLVSTSVLYASTLYAVSHLGKLFSWLNSAPLSLGQMEFITLGESCNSIVQNSIISNDAAQNFITQFQSSVEKELLTQEVLYVQLHNDVSQLYTTLISSGPFIQLINDQTIINKLLSNAAEYCQWIISGNSSDPSIIFVYNGLQDQNLVTKNGVAINNPNTEFLNVAITSIIENAVTTAISQVSGLSLTTQEVFSASPPESSPEVDMQLKALVKNLTQFIQSAHIKQQQTLIRSFAGLYHTSAAIAQVLLKWSDLNLTEILSSTGPQQNPSLSLLQGILPENSQVDNRAIVYILEKLQRAALLIANLSLSPAEAVFFKTVYAPTSLFPISFHALKEIWKFKQLVKTYNDSQNNLLNIIQNPTSEDWQSKLTKLTGWDSNDISIITSSSYLTITTPTINNTDLLNKYFSIATLLGIKVTSLWELAQLSASTEMPVDYSSISNSLYGGLQAQLKDSPATLTKIQNKLNEKLRDKLVPLAIYNLSSGANNLLSNYGNTARGLYAYLLIDVEITGAIQTTYIREAISAIQLYINRCLNQLEPGTTLAKGSMLPTLWQWMQSYREWQANMDVFLYPENYIEPELRVEKTDLFSKAENALKQADLTNPENVEKIFKDYMNGFEEIGSLQVISCAARTYQRDDAEGAQNFKELCMIGVGPSGQGQYYYRLFKFRESASENQYVPYEWGQWKKITASMKTVEYQPGQYGIPKPIFAFGRWYIFWIEQQKCNTINDSSATPPTTYKYYSGTVNFTYLDFNGNWTAPQTILKVDIDQTPIASVTVTTSTPSATTTSYVISTRHEAEVQWFYPEEPMEILPFRAFEVDYSYRPYLFPEVIQSVHDIRCLQYLNSVVNAGTPYGLYAGNGSIDWGLAEHALDVLCFGPNGTINYWFAGTTSGLYGHDYNSRSGWVLVSDIPSSVSVLSICSDNKDNWLVGTSCGLYAFISNVQDGIQTGFWSLVNNGIPTTFNVQCVCYDGTSNWYAGTDIGLYRASSLSGPWSLVSEVPEISVQCLMADSSNQVFAGTSSGLYTNYGGTWVQASPTTQSDYVPMPPGLNIQCLSAANSIWLAGTSSGLYGTTNLASGWWQVGPAQSNGIPSNANVQSLYSAGTNWLAGTTAGLYCWQGNTNGWVIVSTGFPNDINVKCVYNDNQTPANWYAGTSSGLYTTTSANFPNNWTLVSLAYNSIQPTIPSTLVYSGSNISNVFIQGEPNWFIVNGQKDQYLNISYPPGNTPTNFNVYRLNSTVIPSLGALLNAPNGINQLLTISAQEASESLFESLSPVNTYIPSSNYPSDVIDFSNKNAMRMYYWELFFHLPFLVANELNTQQHFAHSKLWYEYVFNPLITTSKDQTNNKYWRFLGLRTDGNNPNQTLADELAEGEIAELRKDLHNAIQLYASESKPFDPQAIAQLRPIAYQKTIVMHYINNILNWGDMLYTENTRDSINEAEMIYVLAYNLLGEQPKDLGPEPLALDACFLDIDSTSGWSQVTSGHFPKNASITCIACENGVIYVGTTNNGLWVYSNNLWINATDKGFKNILFIKAYNGTIYVSAADNGLWTYINNSLVQITTDNFPTGELILCEDEYNKIIYVGTVADGLWAFSNNSWSQITNGFPSNAFLILYIKKYNGIIYVGTGNNGLWTYSNNSWSQVKENNFPTNDIILLESYNGIIYAGTIKHGLWTYSNNSWSQVKENNFPTDDAIDLIKSCSGIITVLTVQNGMWAFSNNSWNQVSSNIINSPITCVTSYNDTIYIGTNNSGLWTYSNKSLIQLTIDNFPTNDAINCIVSFDGMIYVGTSENGLWTYSNNSWSQVKENNFPTNDGTNCIGSYNGIIYVGTNENALWKYSLNYFGIPRNQQFLSYWDEVKQRIYNIRHGLTINGQTDNLPLFSPPINPMDLVEAVGSGESMAQAIQSLSGTIPYYRFEVMIEKAKEYTGMVVQFGQSLLAVLQTKDAQKLAELYAKNERHILSLTQTAKQDNLQYALQTLNSLQQGLINAQNRQTYYAQLITAGLLATEQSQLSLANEAIVAQDVVEGIRIASIVGYSIPTIFGFSDGGFHPGDAINQGAAIAEGVGSIFNQQSGLAGINAGFQRRLQDWQLQAQLAQDDINQINFQIVGAQYQLDLAQQDINLLQKQIEQQKKVAEFYKTKFTNEQLYSWYIGQLSGLYFQAYQLAHDVALQAENAWKFEHIGLPFSNQKDNFIKPAYWNSLYEGLLTGEALQLDLQRMEKSYMDQNVRRFEISKTISLAQLDPIALNNLITTGTCQFDITENDYAWDYPGHYCRKIKSISISIPMVVGPYQNIHATLTQTGSKLINSDGADGQNAVQYLLNPNSVKNPKGTKLSQSNTAIQANLIPNQQIALSQGVNDTGMFQLNFNDPRYLPFEGTGAVSSWQLDIPTEENGINYESITDVIIQINYTAIPAGSDYITAVKKQRGPFNGCHTISLAQEFPGAWNAFVKQASQLQFKVNAQNWQRIKPKSTVNVTTAILCAIGSLPTSLLTLTDTTTNQAITLNQSKSNSQMYTWKGSEKGGFPLTEQSFVLSGLPEGTKGLPNLSNLILIIEYTVSNS